MGSAFCTTQQDTGVASSASPVRRREQQQELRPERSTHFEGYGPSTAFLDILRTVSPPRSPGAMSLTGESSDQSSERSSFSAVFVSTNRCPAMSLRNVAVAPNERHTDTPLSLSIKDQNLALHLLVNEAVLWQRRCHHQSISRPMPLSASWCPKLGVRQVHFMHNFIDSESRRAVRAPNLETALEIMFSLRRAIAGHELFLKKSSTVPQ